ncbi:MAG TPA: L,D-transpeptidase family protein [Allosphingosinicella sp.]|nr:L,D-transpeptidase family protein [Allosphingosinicella sp.]
MGGAGTTAAQTMNQALIRTTLAAAGALMLALPPIGLAFAAQGAGAEPAALAAAPAAAPAPAPGVAAPPAPAPNPVVAEAESLDPGEFVWRPELAPAGPVEIVVSIPLQRAYVYRGGALIGVTTVSTGRRGHATPVGRFSITQKRREHYSNLYNNAPMPFMQRLTNDGIALHAGQIPGYPASHGCVRLPLAFARHLFGVTQVGVAVHIVASSPAPTEALAMVRGTSAYAGMGGPVEDSAN